MQILLPSSWNGVTFDQYQQIIDIVKPDAVLSPLEQLDLNIQILSIFSGVAVGVLEGLSMNRIGELMNQLHWMDQPIKRKHAMFKVKDIDRIIYDMSVHFNKLVETKSTKYSNRNNGHLRRSKQRRLRKVVFSVSPVPSE
jgi:hypothetical protein